MSKSARFKGFHSISGIQKSVKMIMHFIQIVTFIAYDVNCNITVVRCNTAVIYVINCGKMFYKVGEVSCLQLFLPDPSLLFTSVILIILDQQNQRLLATQR